MKGKIIYGVVLIALMAGCYEGYQPRVINMAGNWIVFELPVTEMEGVPVADYTLVTAPDPNRSKQLIIDNLYNAGVRIRSPHTDGVFEIRYAPQLDTLDDVQYGIRFVTLDGEISNNYYVQQLAYSYVQAYFPNMAFSVDDIEDVIFINAGFYDSDTALIDTVAIFGYRKTGFENVEY